MGQLYRYGECERPDHSDQHPLEDPDDHPDADDHTDAVAHSDENTNGDEWAHGDPHADPRGNGHTDRGAVCDAHPIQHTDHGAVGDTDECSQRNTDDDGSHEYPHAVPADQHTDPARVQRLLKRAGAPQPAGPRRVCHAPSSLCLGVERQRAESFVQARLKRSALL